MESAVPPQLELALSAAPEAELPGRLRRLGIHPTLPIVLTRNRTVMLSFDLRKELRLHAGYAWAPEEVLRAIVTFVTPGRRRSERLAARRLFMSFAVEHHAPVRKARRGAAPADADLPRIERLTRLHTILNERHFGGALTSVPLRLSDRMERRLGEFSVQLDGSEGQITISRRHILRDGWGPATDTLLHEMVHQWQAETGRTIDHGHAFRSKAREVGIRARATVRRQDWRAG